jgi:hypothetical protein
MSAAVPTVECQMEEDVAQWRGRDLRVVAVAGPVLPQLRRNLPHQKRRYSIISPNRLRAFHQGLKDTGFVECEYCSCRLPVDNFGCALPRK